MNRLQILKGTRDFGQEEMAKRNKVRTVIEKVFKSFGYDNIETPAIEYAETILNKYGEEGNKLTYTFTDHGGRDIALRYDQTVPFARYFAKYHGALTVPFKRYEINRVWRADKPQKGRYREFYQCDVDIIGTNSLLAELELAEIIYCCLSELGFQDFKIKINDRRLIDAVLDSLSIEQNKRIEVVRIIDKLDKIGLNEALELLIDLGVSKKAVSELELLLKNPTDLSAFSQFNAQFLNDFFDLLQKMEFRKYVEFDFRLARGLDYYTGLIFEADITNSEVGSVAGGGRYDNLTGSFCKNEFTGVGIALGFDRIIEAMNDLHLLDKIGLNSIVMFSNLGEKPNLISWKAMKELRKIGINCEIYFDCVDLAKQLKYANKKNIPYVVIIGEDEMKNNEFLVKEMASGKQTKVKQKELSDFFVNS